MTFSLQILHINEILKLKFKSKYIVPLSSPIRQQNLIIQYKNQAEQFILLQPN